MLTNDIIAALQAFGVVKSIQYGSVSGAGTTTTITAVNTNKALVVNLGMNAQSATNDPRNCVMSFTLTNATTVTSSGGAASCVTKFAVLEFWG